MKAIIASLSLNPGHFSFLAAAYKLFEDCGYDSYLYVNPLFDKVYENNEFKKINNTAELNEISDISVVLFGSPSLRNIKEMIRFRYKYKAKIIYVYHEPFDSIMNYYKSGYGLIKIIKVCLINLVSIPMLLLSNSVILPSNSSYFAYKRKYLFFNKNATSIPLLFDDYASVSILEHPKKYLSYIGTIAVDHAFSEFVNFVDMALTNNWFTDCVFLIATSSQIPVKEKNILDKHKDSNMLIISSGFFMTNEEINNYYKNSIVVWNAYHRSMQSGVLPKAYMFGAAVIVLKRNANEFIKDNYTGFLIEDNGNVQEIRAAIQKILDKKEIFINNCREVFLKTFFYKFKKDDYSLVLKK